MISFSFVLNASQRKEPLTITLILTLALTLTLTPILTLTLSLVLDVFQRKDRLHMEFALGHPVSVGCENDGYDVMCIFAM